MKTKSKFRTFTIFTAILLALLLILPQARASVFADSGPDNIGPDPGFNYAQTYILTDSTEHYYAYGELKGVQQIEHFNWAFPNDLTNFLSNYNYPTNFEKD